MDQNKFSKFLQGSDLRTLGESQEVLNFDISQTDFDKLVDLLNSKERSIKMKVIDLIEKISKKNKHYLDLHKDYFLSFIQKDLDIEFKWHLVQIIPRLNLTSQELENVWNFLTEILKNKKESRIVRAFSITTTEELFKIDKIKYKKFKQLVANVQKENIPSLNSKIKKFLIHK